MARHDMCMRLKSGREFRFSCEEYMIKRYSMTQDLVEVEFKNVIGECPKYFKTDNIESISEYIEDEGADDAKQGIQIAERQESRI